MGLLDSSLWDNYKHAIEALSGGRNTVVFDDQKLPSVMVRIPAFSVEDINTNLGTGSHPAFVVGGTQKTSILIGMYNSYVYGTRAYSLPYKDPTCSVDFDTALNDCLRKNQGDTTRRAGWHMMTNWEAAALALLCIKNGQPSGNTDYGRHHANKQQTGVRQDSLLPGTASGVARTLTGSGPVAWRHNGTESGIADLVGNVWEWCDGMKTTAGVFSMPNDNDYTALEAAWVNQGVFIANDGAAKLGTGADTLYPNGGTSFGAWKSLTRTAAYTALAAAVKNRMMQAMIDPAFDSVNPVGIFYFDTTTERIPVRFGNWSDAADAGVAALTLGGARSYAGVNVGFRLAYIS